VNLATVGSAAARAEHGPVLPTRDELAVLGRFERLAVRLAERVQRHAAAKALSQALLWHVNQRWVRGVTRRVTHVHGADVIPGLDAGRGVLLCSNHRSFFDQFVIMTWYSHTLGRLPHLYFPVRSNFFYEGPLGVVVNAAMSGFAMYPPIFRAPSKAAFNRYTQARLVELLGQPDTVVGVHPEGRRNKGLDPYALLPAQPGVGQLILDARPTVVPVFVNGLSNNFMAQIAGGLLRRAAPVVIVFGRPLDLALDGLPNRLRTHRDLAEQVLDAVRRLGTVEREIRAGLA
jgi:1-acyl-sn-glycerol-3-phosphate acyltransferase